MEAQSAPNNPVRQSNRSLEAWELTINKPAVSDIANAIQGEKKKRPTG
jgi:hypothetical protein